MKTKPEFVVTKAAKEWFLTQLLEETLTRLRVYKGAEHSHASQAPVVREF